MDDFDDDDDDADDKITCRTVLVGLLGRPGLVCLLPSLTLMVGIGLWYRTLCSLNHLSLSKYWLVCGAKKGFCYSLLIFAGENVVLKRRRGHNGSQKKEMEPHRPARQRQAPDITTYYNYTTKMMKTIKSLQCVWGVYLRFDRIPQKTSYHTPCTTSPGLVPKRCAQSCTFP